MTLVEERAEAALATPDIAEELEGPKVFKPQAGPQEAILATNADIAIYGGAAGGGKTTALLWEAGRYTSVPGFTAVIFRRTHPEIINPGGLWDESQLYYPALGGIARESVTTWNFPFTGAAIKFSHMQHESDKMKWQGSQLAFIGFDEVTHFSRAQFFYLMSRNRSMCGIRPYIRATCNPDPDSFVRELIDWWIGEDGYPIRARAGIIRYFGRKGEDLIWADTREEIMKLGIRPKSFTFIDAKLSDNPALMTADPDYQGNLEALPRHERERLLGGNWDARPMAGDYFQRQWFTVIEPGDVPANGRTVRWWDRAATEPSERNPDPDWTAGVRIKEYRGNYYIEDIVRFRGNPLRVERTILATASQEPEVEILLPQDPGAAGVMEVQALIKKLGSYKVTKCTEVGSKATRMVPVSAQANAGNVYVVRGKWNEAFFNEAEAYDGSDKNKDDQLDGLSGGYNHINGGPANPRVRSF